MTFNHQRPNSSRLEDGTPLPAHLNHQKKKTDHSLRIARATKSSTARNRLREFWPLLIDTMTLRRAVNNPKSALSSCVVNYCRLDHRNNCWSLPMILIECRIPLFSQVVTKFSYVQSRVIGLDHARSAVRTARGLVA